MLNHGVKVLWKRAGGRHPLTHNGRSIAELVHRRPTDSIVLVAAPRSQKGRFPDTRKPAEERMTMLLNQVREFLKFLCSSDEGMTHAFLNGKRWLFFGTGFGMLVKPRSPFFRDVVDLTATSAATDDVRHPDGDVFLVEQDVQRLIESRANHAHGVRQTGQRNVARHIPCLCQCVREPPEVAQEFLLASAQHGNRKGSAASFMKHPSSCVPRETGLAF